MELIDLWPTPLYKFVIGDNKYSYVPKVIPLQGKAPKAKTILDVSH